MSSPTASWAVSDAYVASIDSSATAALRQKAGALVAQSAANDTTMMFHGGSDGFGIVRTCASDNQADSVFHGHLGPLEIEFHLSLIFENGVVTITAMLDKPIQLGPFTWQFNVGGGPESQPVTLMTQGVQGAALTISPGCLLECASILGPVVAQCLPQISNPADFVKCLISKAGEKILPLVACLIKCFI